MMEQLVSWKASWQALAIVVLGCCVGLVVNMVRTDGLDLTGSFTGETSSVPGKGDELRITVEEAEGFFLSQGAVFLDTRDERAYASAHIQSAKNLPWGDFDAEYETILEGVEKDDFIICYCDGADCNSSEHVAIALLERGYSNVYVLFGGWSLWQQRNLPIEGVNDLFSK